MRTQYSHRRSSSRWPIVLGLVLIFAIVVFALRFLLPGAFFALANPLFKTGTALTGSTGNVLASFASNAQLAHENRDLAAEVESLQNQNAALTARTQDLTKLLGGEGQSVPGITAGVLARPPLSPYDTLEVAAGSADGVTAGSPVFAQGGVPIGVVQSKTAHTALIALLSSPGKNTDAWIGANRIPITLMGVGGGAFIATIAKNAAITTGDGVYVSGPGAIPMGTVVKVDSDPSSPSVTLRIQPTVNIFSVTWVMIGPKASS